MRKIAAAAGIHELALPALLAQIDRRIARRLPARLIPHLVDRVLEDVERRPCDAVARDPQHIVRLDGAVGHDRAQFDRLVADALGRRIVAEQGGDHIGDGPDVDRGPAAVCLHPQFEQAVVERRDRWRSLIHRRVRDHDVIAGNAAIGEKVDIVHGRISGVADRQRCDGNVARDQHAGGAFHGGVRARALERPTVDVMDVRRSIQADRNRNIVGLETVQPFVIDQHAVGGHRDRYLAACAR